MPTSQRQRIRMNRSPKQERGVLIADALWTTLNEEAVDAEGRQTKRLRKVADKLVEQAEAGNIRAAELIFDRLGGKPTQQVQAAVEMRHEDWVDRMVEVRPGVYELADETH